MAVAIAVAVAGAVMVTVGVGAAVLHIAVVLRRKIANTLAYGAEETEAREMVVVEGARLMSVVVAVVGVGGAGVQKEFVSLVVLVGEIVDLARTGGFPVGPPLRGEVEGHHLWRRNKIIGEMVSTDGPSSRPFSNRSWLNRQPAAGHGRTVAATLVPVLVLVTLPGGAQSPLALLWCTRRKRGVVFPFVGLGWRRRKSEIGSNSGGGGGAGGSPARKEVCRNLLDLRAW